MLCAMFIRRTRTRTGAGGEVYYSHRLVRSERTGEKVRQRTLLNLGSDFPLERHHRSVLCARIRQLLDRQSDLVALSCPAEVERHAQRLVAQLLNGAPSGGGADLQTVDVGTLELIRPRSAGVEHVGLWAMEELGLEGLLERLGFNGPQRALAMASIVARMAGFGARLLALAVRAFVARRVTGRGLRAHEHDAPLPRLRCPDVAPRDDRGASVRPGDGSVQACAAR